MIVDLKEETKKSEYYSKLVKEADSYMELHYRECVPVDPMIRIDVEIITGDLIDKSFSHIIDTYGYNYLLGLIEFLTETEEYELCKDLVDALKEHNKKKGSALPTSISGLRDMKK